MYSKVCTDHRRGDFSQQTPKATLTGRFTSAGTDPSVFCSCFFDFRLFIYCVLPFRLEISFWGIIERHYENAAEADLVHTNS